MLQHIVCLSVRPSDCLYVTLRYDFHAGSNTSKFENNFTVEYPQNLQNLRNGARQDQCYYVRLIGSHIRAFDWHQNQ